MDQMADAASQNIAVVPVVVMSATFPAGKSSIPGIGDFVRRCLASSPLSGEDNGEVGHTVAQALLETASGADAISVSLRIFPGHVEVDVLRSGAQIGTPAPVTAVTSLTSALRSEEQAAAAQASAPDDAPVRNGAPVPDDAPVRNDAPVSDSAAVRNDAPAEPAFAGWLAAVLRREGLTMEAAARQLGVSAKTVSRWAGGTTEPRLRELRRIRARFGDLPFP